ncbi:GTP cyclohydrolase [Flavobacterium sp.]|uniref:GTP cyclohydrolase n=1 Tax=Flavobacterium sp. TaxID=239 RepID=UPI004048710C
MIQIKEVVTKKEMKEFILFPFELFKKNPYWVPPIISDELTNFDKNVNPVFKHADAHFYVALKDNKIVGRIVAIINWQEVKELGKNKVRFGWFDVIDDIEVTKALLEKVYEFGRSHKMDHAEGPIGFSNLDKVGVLTEGFDQMGTMISWYSNPYYKEHFEKLGLNIEKEFIESVFPFSNVKPEMFVRASKMVKERYKLSFKTYTKTSEIMPHVDEMFELFNTSYAKLQSFVAVSPEQIEYIKKKNISFINPEYIQFVFDENKKMVAFSIVMPSFAEALQKAKGKLFPFGFWHLLQAKKHSKDVVFYLIGVTPEYQSRGLTAILFEGYYNVFTKKGIKTCIRTAELEENHAIHNLWKNFDPKIHKKRKTYSIAI